MKKLLLAVAACLVACGQPIEAFCEELEASQCGPSKACGVAASDASCDDISNNSRRAPVCLAPLREAVKKGTVRYDAAEAKKCVDALNTQCQPKDACDKVFTGTVATGGACTTSEECSGEAWCDRTSTCPGACAAKLGAGAKIPVLEACSTGRVRSTSSGEMTCLAAPNEGDACTSSSECRIGFSCRDNTCATSPGKDQPCDGNTCAVGLRCVQGTCLALAKRGESCVNDSRSDGAPCQAGLTCRDGTCGDALRENESCEGNSSRCGAGLECETNTCVLRGVDGAACDSNFDCQLGFWCDVNDLCAAQQASGGACAKDDACQPGLTCLEAKCQVPVCTP